MVCFFVLLITEGLLLVSDNKNINKINRNLNLVCTIEVKIKTSIHNIFQNKRIKNKNFLSKSYFQLNKFFLNFFGNRRLSQNRF